VKHGLTLQLFWIMQRALKNVYELASNSVIPPRHSLRSSRIMEKRIATPIKKLKADTYLYIYLKYAMFYRPGILPLDRDVLSPRYIIPQEYRVTLLSRGGNKFSIRLSYEANDGRWKNVTLDNVKEVLKNSKNVAIVSNLKQALTCSIIAIEDKPYLYQT